MQAITQTQPRGISATFKIVLVVVVLLVGVGITLRLLTPKTAPPPTLSQGNFDQSNSQFKEVTFVGQPKPIPPKLWTLTAEASSTTATDALLKSLIAQYQLTPSPHVATIWNGSTHSLVYDQERNEYVLSKNTARSTTPLPLNKAAAASQQVLNQLQIGQDYSLINSQVQYLMGGQEPSPATPELATTLVLPYSVMIYDIPVLIGQDEQVPLATWVTSADGVIKVIYKPLDSTFKPYGQFPAVSVSQALDQFRQGNGAFITAFNPAIVPSLDTITTARLTSNSLEYRFDTTTQTLVPYHRFAGTFTNANNDQFEGEVITPAVANK